MGHDGRLNTPVPRLTLCITIRIHWTVRRCGQPWKRRELTTSYHVNPLTGKHMNVAFFRMNPSAKLPVFQNGAHVIFHAIDIIQYIDRLAVHLSGGIQSVNTEVLQWMQKVDGWNPKMFTLTHTH